VAVNKWSLRQWWRELWRRRAAPATTDPGGPGASGAGGTTIESDDAAPRVPPRRRYTAPPADDDPQREARLGAVLEALRAGALRRDELDARVGATDWGPGRLDAVVAHGVASGVLVETDGGVVKARYAD
jgi:hypothetical protein